MSLQTIIDNATYITIDRKKTAAQSISRSGRLLTAELASAVPYRFVVGMHEGLKYSTDGRGLVEDLDALDITVESEINIGNTNTGLNYITKYQGDVTAADLANINVQSQTGAAGNVANVVLDTRNVLNSYTTLFKKGDYISFDNSYRYAYTIQSDVAWASAEFVNVPVHRNIIQQDSYNFNLKGIRVGVDCTFPVKMITKPSYNIVPHDRLQFNSDFELVEVIRKEDT
jgi:hypothetical protein